MAKRKICVVTGSRAEYGLLYWLLKEIQGDPDLDLQLVVTGMHLSAEFGMTFRTIEEDGFRIDDKVEMLLSSDTPIGITKSIGLGVIGFADAFARLKPDILVVLGDRYEILAAAQAGLIARIPMAHLVGGDVTEGAYDEAIRHSLTKMSHLHFVTNEAALKRVVQMGENPAHVYNVGNPGIDFILRTKLMERADLEKLLNFRFRKKNLLVTYHPVTLEIEPLSEQFQALLSALELLGGDTGIIFTSPNADNDGRTIMRMIEEYVASHPNARSYASLGQIPYLSTVAQMDAVVGNSSSGLYEVPSFKKPAVNIGDRQKGRLQAASVINCAPRTEAILEAIYLAFEMDCSDVVNPYGDGNSSRKIAAVLKTVPDPQQLLKKHFFDLDVPNTR